MTDDVIREIAYRETLAYLLARDDADDAMEALRILAELGQHEPSVRLWSLWTSPRN